MVKRMQLTDKVVMLLEGQTTIVLPGSVIDVPDSMQFASTHAIQLSPGEAAGALNSLNKPTSVRNIKKV